jgi:hypothetical protein
MTITSSTLQTHTQVPQLQSGLSTFKSCVVVEKKGSILFPAIALLYSNRAVWCPTTAKRGHSNVHEQLFSRDLPVLRTIPYCSQSTCTMQMQYGVLLSFG